MSSNNYTIDYALVKTMAEVFIEDAKDIEDHKKKMNTSTGEMKDTYQKIHDDILWKLQNKIIKLWYYVSGSVDFEPIVRKELQEVIESKEPEPEPLKEVVVSTD